GPRAGLSPPRQERPSSAEAIFFPPDAADLGPSWEEVVVNVEQLRKQAKELVRAARAGDPAAAARLGDLPPQLASAQLVLAREHGYSSWPALVHELAEQPFHTDLDYYEGRAYGIATVNGVSVAAARRDLAQRHGLASWAELTRRVQALASGAEPPTPFMLAYRAVEDGDV